MTGFRSDCKWLVQDYSTYVFINIFVNFTEQYRNYIRLLKSVLERTMQSFVFLSTNDLITLYLQGWVPYG